MLETEHPAIHLIGNSEIVLRHFGFWPSLHDAVIDGISIEVLPPLAQVSVTLVIAAHEMIDEVDEQGHYKLIKHCNIELQFIGAQEMTLDFRHHPIIFGVRFEAGDNSIKCTLDSSAGLDTIVADAAIILGLTPTAGRDY